MSYLTFELIPPPFDRKTPLWWVKNTTQNAILGKISFKPAWRKFTFTQVGPGIDFDSVCLHEICDFLEVESAKWRLDHARR